ncbi:hypothetical protein FGG08_000446 [Glutinoglossum americanum]|uniref:Fungal lipase-type domain-containing protein n=1 Tax=Glutinoglossum americanum TaxID=1670608 RepID=A0A9P8L5Z8_9PEZI|nr:hypothetical protein FGG08_000446 [Glutinoglossum americanum]
MNLRKHFHRAVPVLTHSAPVVRPFAQGPSASRPSTPSADNSFGASTTGRELLEYLGEDSEDLFEPESLSEADHERLQDLKGLGESWRNSRVDVRGGEWRWASLHSPPSVAPFIHLASHASNAIRPKPSPAPDIPPGTSSFQLIKHIDSSALGVVKATSLYRATITSTGEEVVVVVVRACGGIGDWVIDGNMGMAAVEGDIIDMSVLSPNTEGSDQPQRHPPPLEAHRGFLHTVRGSISKVASALEAAIRTAAGPQRPRVLFVGHSAGGAMAGLLFAHFVTCVRRYPFLDPPSEERGSGKISLNCVTFGALPAVSQNITPCIESCLTARSGGGSPPSIFIAIIIEGDPCIRLDMAYAIFLVQHLRSLHTSGSANAQQQQQPQTQRQNSPAPPPPLTMHALGKMAMFRNLNLYGAERDIRMYGIEENELEGVAFMDFTVHFMWRHMELVSEVIRQENS